MKSKVVFSAVLILCLLQVIAAAQTLPQVKKNLPLRHGLPAMAQPNGEYVVSVWKDGGWREAGRLACDRFLREGALDLSPYLTGEGAARMRISEEGPGAAHIDSVFLGGRPPKMAKGENCEVVLKKLSATDHDLINAERRSYELTFPADTGDKTLKLAARIESAEIGTEPLQFPKSNTFTRISPSSDFYSYDLGGAAPPGGELGSRERLEEVGGRTPFFMVVSSTSSGHPTGPTYGWVSDDGKNLYVTLDFTPDNTFDGDKDYAKVYVKTGECVREFRVSAPETRWGTAHFLYTDKAVYEHKVYDFVIPLSELKEVSETGRLELAFAAYGTATAQSSYSPSLAFDPGNNRYLLVYETSPGADYDIVGLLLDENGQYITGSFMTICGAGGDQVVPDVAFDRASGRFLVVWQDYREAPMCADVFGQLVNADGSFYGENFVIATDYLCQYDPAVANDGNHGQFLVVWHQHYLAETGYDIFGQLVDGEGNLVAPADDTAAFRTQATANGDTYNFIISDAEGDQRQADVAFDAQANAYLVVFTEREPAPDFNLQSAGKAPIYISTAIKGHFVTWDGLPLYGDPDENLLISNPAIQAIHAAIANDGINHRFLVAFADDPVENGGGPEQQGAQDAPGAGRIHGSRSGAAEGGGTAIPHDREAMAGLDLPSGTAVRQGKPVPRTQDALHANDEQSFIYGHLVDTAGNVLNDERLLLSDESEELPDYLELDRSHPALAFDPSCLHYLLFYFCQWWDDDTGLDGGEVEGRYLDASGGLASESLIEADWYDAWAIDDMGPAVADNPNARNFVMAFPCYCGSIHRRLMDVLDCATLPEVITAAVTDVTPTAAKSGGEVTSDGGAEVTVRGVCWNTTGGPTLADSRTTNGAGLGSFASVLTGLTPNTKYYVRAYATNSVGTAYGNERTFTTLKQFIVTFIAGTGGSVSGTQVQYVTEGANCTPVEAVANPGYCFINWTGTGGFGGSTANPLTVTNVRQDMTITANFGRLALAVQKMTERAWIIQRYYALVALSVDGLAPGVTYRYVLNRKVSGGAYQAVKEFTSADLENNTYTYEDKFLEADLTYVYQIVAYNPGGQVIGRSQEITVQ